MQPNRDVDVTWRPISLLMKNQPEPGSEYHDASTRSHRMLRVMEAVRAAADDPDAGNEAVARLYWELGSRIHHGGDLDFDVADALAAVDLDTELASAADDEIWDQVVRAGMDEGLRLTGDDVGTPLLALTDDDGVRHGYFGPVILDIPPTEDSLAMWDALTTMMRIDGFYELKKTRDGAPEFGDDPDER